MSKLADTFDQQYEAVKKAIAAGEVNGRKDARAKLRIGASRYDKIKAKLIESGEGYIGSDGYIKISPPRGPRLLDQIDDASRQCARKNIYPSEEAAQKVANKIRYERGTKLRWYFCLACRGFHLTKKGVNDEDQSGV